MSNEFILQPKPEWANYLAQDADGEWGWFKEKPNIEFDQYFGQLWVLTDDKWQSAGYGSPPAHPETMLFHCDADGNRTLVEK